MAWTAVPPTARTLILVEAMAGRLGLGTLAIYGREYLVAVSPKAGALLLYTLHHAAEWRERW